ncbi:MAG: DUF6268 family outer membrane beta-barrel protein [Verrucomicrobia bacterium]|jgi:hypothetical protein|nr:DUF6268 family outer membrane beta-barrel protein [Verrucomicrobiota bacterium]MDA1078456.1 DUF6268 family outer membrane beta-barrel protein [Verrucomicrobiota bacterium]
MKKIALIFTLIASHLVLTAQDFISDSAAIKISYGSSPDRKVEGTNVEIGGSQWELMTPLYYHDGGDWSFGAGLRYQSTDIDISDSSFLMEDHLQSLELALFLSKDYSDTLKGIALFVPGMAGDFDATGSDAMNYMALAGVRWQKSETFQWIFGAFYSTGFDDDMFLPAIGFMWEPSDQMDLVFAGPIIRYRYSLSDSVDWILGGQFSGNRWKTEGQYTGGNDPEFAMTAYRLYTTLQWNPSEKHGVFASIGAELGREVALKYTNGVESDQDLKSAPSFEIGYRFRF